MTATPGEAETALPASTASPCPVCAAAAPRTYCADCGAEQARTRRLRTVPLVRDALLQFFNLEGPGLRTITGLAIRPGKVIRAYLDGERRRIVNPLKLAFVTGALVVLAYAIVRKPEEMPQGDELDTVSILNVINFAAIPIFGLTSWGLLRSARLTLAEHVVIGYFIYALAMLGQGLLVIAQLHRSVLAANAFAIVVSVYLVWAPCSAWRARWWKGVIVAIVAITLTTLLASVLLRGLIRVHAWWVATNG